MNSNLRAETLKFLLTSGGAASLPADSLDAVFEACDLWRVLPQLDQALARSGMSLPDPVAARMRRRLAESFAQSANCVRAGIGALEALTAAGIPCAAFKGLAAIAHLYPGVGRRVVQDVDVLIDPEHLAAALAALEKIGLRRSISEDLDSYLEFVRNSPGSGGNEALSLSDSRQGVVDLHWQLGRIEFANLKTEVRSATVLGRSVPVLSPQVGVLLTAHHALRDDFSVDKIARDVIDSAAWFRLLEAREIGDVMQRARRWNLAGAVLAMELITGALGASGPRLFAGYASVAEQRSADDIQELYFHQLERGPLNRDLVYLTSVKPAFQILRGGLSGWTRYREAMRKMESLNGEADGSLASRTRSLVTAASRLPFRRWRQVRALSRLKQSAGPN